MVQTGQTSEAEKYIMQMLDAGAGDRPEEISRSGNIVVDSLINHAYAAAQKTIYSLLSMSLYLHPFHLKADI